MVKKKFWGRNTVSRDTLRNHYCKTVNEFDDAVAHLKNLGLVNYSPKNGAMSLQSSKQDEIELYL